MRKNIEKYLDNKVPSIERLKLLISFLRDPDDGCPWDKIQNHESLIKGLLEESYEVIHAIYQKDQKNLKEELGDLLLQVLMHSQIASEDEYFNFDDVIENLIAKLIVRHEHIFTENKISLEEHSIKWEEKKVKEKFSITFPAFKYAERINQQIDEENFKYGNIKEIFDKIDEEVNEIKEAIDENDNDHIKEEIGDLLFTISSLAYRFNIDAEEAHLAAIEKFNKRFKKFKNYIKNENKIIDDYNSQELNQIWNKIKNDSN